MNKVEVFKKIVSTSFVFFHVLSLYNIKGFISKIKEINEKPDNTNSILDINIATYLTKRDNSKIMNVGIFKNATETISKGIENVQTSLFGQDSLLGEEKFTEFVNLITLIDKSPEKQAWIILKCYDFWILGENAEIKKIKGMQISKQDNIDVVYDQYNAFVNKNVILIIKNIYSESSAKYGNGMTDIYTTILNEKYTNIVANVKYMLERNFSDTDLVGILKALKDSVEEHKLFNS